MQLFYNNAETTTTSAITSTAGSGGVYSTTTVSITSAIFGTSALATFDYIVATLSNADGTITESVKIISITNSGLTLTFSRYYERVNTMLSLDWPIGSKLSCRLTARALTSGIESIYRSDSASIDIAYSRNPSGVIVDNSSYGMLKAIAISLQSNLPVNTILLSLYAALGDRVVVPVSLILYNPSNTVVTAPVITLGNSASNTTLGTTAGLSVGSGTLQARGVMKTSGPGSALCTSTSTYSNLVVTTTGSGTSTLRLIFEYYYLIG